MKKQMIPYVLSAIPILLGALGGIWYTFEQNGNGIYYLLTMVILFVTLLVGYRFGAGSGGVCGTACGILMALWGGNTGYLGIYCMIGFLAGLFSPLGKTGSLIAYLTGAVGCGMMISPGWLFETLYQLLAAGMFFFLLPIKKEKGAFGTATGVEAAGLGGNRGGKKDAFPCLKGDQKHWGEVLLHQESFEQYEQAFGVLADSMHRIPKGICLNTEGTQGEELVWRNRYMENCNILANQYEELCAAIRRMKEDILEGHALEEECREALARELKRRGIGLGQVICVQKASGSEMYMTVYARKGEVISVREVCSGVSKCLREPWRNAPDGPRIITEEPVQLHMEKREELTVLHGTARCVKDGSAQSGDSFSAVRLSHQKYLLALCDGAGSGCSAAAQSRDVLDMTERLLEAGFEPKNAMKTVQSSLLLGYSQYPVSLDVAIVDLAAGGVHFLKCGAAASYVKQGQKVRVVDGASLPMGVIMDAVPEETMEQAGENAYIVMVTDGVLEGIAGYNQEERLRDFLQNYQGTNPKQMAADILELASKPSGTPMADDCSVLVGLLTANAS